MALPATFTLATARGSRALAGRGVLPTRLSAIDEAAADVAIISSLAISGTLMAPLPVWLIGCLLAAAAAFAFILDAIKAVLFARLRMA